MGWIVKSSQVKGLQAVLKYPNPLTEGNPRGQQISPAFQHGRDPSPGPQTGGPRWKSKPLVFEGKLQRGTGYDARARNSKAQLAVQVTPIH